MFCNRAAFCASPRLARSCWWADVSRYCAAQDDLEITASQATIRSDRLTFAADALTFVAKLLTQTLGRWQSSAQNMDVVATDLATKAARRVTVVDEADMLQAGSVLQKIQSTSVTQAEAVVIAVNEDLRLDGARVTVG
jgi:uncharacterized protein YfaQ (DUF2300 family)